MGACDDLDESIPDQAFNAVQEAASRFEVTQILQQSGSGDGTFFVDIFDAFGSVKGSNTGTVPTNSNGPVSIDFTFDTSEKAIDSDGNGIEDESALIRFLVDGFVANSVFADSGSTGSGEASITAFINIDFRGTYRIRNSDGLLCLIQFDTPSIALDNN